MKPYTDQEFAEIIDECAAEVAEMLKPKAPEPTPKASWRQRVIEVLY